ncbi:uncharacterized protein LOC134327104 [Trichomycterus rosablanca]|uniref:uncharacterized protein LOC134327104 n=1 Tax=Trichomycterus rosablanca TaxID=2290929 RepID=UPI002F35B1F9
MGTRRLCCLLVFLLIASVYSFHILNSIKDLSAVKFGKTFPRHGLLLLYWLVCEGTLDNNGNLHLNFNPGEGHFGFHLYKNYDNVFPNLVNTNYAYYTVGNLNPKMENPQLPDYVTEDFKNYWHRQNNIDRIVIKVQKNNPAIVYEIYITQHSEDRNRGSDYDGSLTYKISEDLLREIAEYCIETEEKKKDKEDPIDQRFARIQQKFQNYPLLQAFLYQTGYDNKNEFKQCYKRYHSNRNLQLHDLLLELKSTADGIARIIWSGIPADMLETEMKIGIYKDENEEKPINEYPLNGRASGEIVTSLKLYRGLQLRLMKLAIFESIYESAEYDNTNEVPPATTEGSIISSIIFWGLITVVVAVVVSAVFASNQRPAPQIVVVSHGRPGY